MQTSNETKSTFHNMLEYLEHVCNIIFNILFSDEYTAMQLEYLYEFYTKNCLLVNFISYEGTFDNTLKLLNYLTFPGN